MTSIKQILLPTDFSEASRPAVEYACGMAEKFDAHLHILHVITDPTTQVPDFGMGLAFPGYLENLPERMQQMEERAIRALAHVLPEGWSDGRHVTLATKQGTAFVEIIRYVREHGIDLVVLGTHGHTGLAHAFLGSVAEKVVRKAPCPVLTVRPQGHTFEHP